MHEVLRENIISLKDADRANYDWITSPVKVKLIIPKRKSISFARGQIPTHVQKSSIGISKEQLVYFENGLEVANRKISSFAT